MTGRLVPDARRAIARLVSTTIACAMLASCASTPPDARPRVALDTSMGRIVLELDAERAPITTANFLEYVRDGQYVGTTFHRVMADFVVQGGGHDAQMAEKPTRGAIVSEAANGLSNTAGTVAMARTADPNSARAQFFINVVDNVRLDHRAVPPEGVVITRGGREERVMPAEADRVYGYAVFGRVVEGMDVVERIRYVPVRTVGEYQNVPVQPIYIVRAVRLPRFTPMQ